MSNLITRAIDLVSFMGLMACLAIPAALAGDLSETAPPGIARDIEKGTVSFHFPDGPPLLVYRRLYPPATAGCVAAKLDLWIDKGQVTVSGLVPFAEKEKDYSSSISDNGEITFMAGLPTCRVRVGIDRGAKDHESNPPSGTDRRSLDGTAASDFPDRPPSRIYRSLYPSAAAGCVSAKLDIWLEHGRYAFSPFVPSPDETKDFAFAIPENGEVSFTFGSPTCRIRVWIDRGE